MPKRESRIVDPSRFGSLAHFLESKPEPGVWEINHHGLAFHAYFDWRGADTTLVTFTGAVSRKVVEVPVWSAFGATKGVGVNRLFLSDPTLGISKRLRLGWYSGNSAQPDLENDISCVIDHVAQGTRVVLFGPSGGGFTALVQASRLHGSTAIVSNPQTDISIRPAFVPYLKIAWNGLSQDAVPFTTEVITTYQHPVDTKIVYIQNIGDKHHVEKHQGPFLESLHPNNKLIELSPALGPGHVGPNAESFKELFRTVCETNRWSRMVEAAQAVDLRR